MKLLLKDEAGEKIEVDVTSTDSFADITGKVSNEHGIVLDVEGLSTESRPIHSHMNVLDYFSSTASSEKKIQPNEEIIEFPLNPCRNGESLQNNDIPSSNAEICRLCATHTMDDLQPIEGFLEKISSCLPIKVLKDDCLSQKICFDCIQQLDNVTSFVNRCLKADVIQRENRAKQPPTLLTTPKKRPLYFCDVCQKKFRSRFRLSFHLQLHEKGKNAGSCTLCGKDFPSETCLFKHVVYNHRNRQSFLCHHCGMSLSNKSSLSSHERLHNNSDAMRPFICDICNRCFARKNILKDHLVARHSVVPKNDDPLFECSACYEVFPSNNDGMTHSYIHHGFNTPRLDLIFVPKLFICEFCDRCFRLSDKLIEHRRIHIPPDPYHCKLCNHEFSNYLSLQSHLNDHQQDGVMDFKANFSIPVVLACEYCETCFVSYQSFREHCKTHDGRYKCLFCTESFDTFDAAKAHKVIHPKVLEGGPSSKPYNCQFCGRSFACCSALTKHIRSHTREKPFECTKCPKKFSQSSGLYTHFKVHSDIRPYKCDICERAFKIIGDYKVHVRRHSGERPFLCPICPKAFLTKKTYLQHKRAHDGIRAFKCDICQTAFRKSHTLKLHLLRHHVPVS